jgi:ribosomal protein S18 acetylase RimI-like enzyme
MVTVTFGVPEDQTKAAAEILYEAFHHKFAAIFGPKQQTITLLSEHLRDDRTVAAFHENTLVGVGGLKFGGKESIDITFWQLLRILKFRIFRFFVLGWVFYSTVENDELLVDMLAVAPTMRRKGVGSALMDFIIDFAQSEGYTHVRLFVIDTNESAKRFYETKGFKEKRVHTLIFPWNKILAFDSAYEMVYIV